MVNRANLVRSLSDCSAAEEARAELQAARAQLEAERAQLVAVRVELDAEKKKNRSTRRRMAEMTKWSNEMERTYNQVLAACQNFRPLREFDAEVVDKPR